MRLATFVGLPIAAVTCLGAATPAHADSFEATRSVLLVERDHDIALTMHYGHAELVVRRTVFNGGERHDQATFWIDVPQGGVAVGLRTLATLNGRPHWYDGELLEAELAAERYRELTGLGGYYPKDPALLSWRSASQLALQVFPCSPSEAKSVEYTMVIPTTYQDGRYTLSLPALGTEAVTARVAVVGETVRDQVFVDDSPVGRGTVVSMTEEHIFGLGRAAAPRLEGGLAAVSIADERALFHYEIEAAAKLSRVPRHADVVVLLDRSRSIGEGDRAAEVALARSYLAHFESPGLDARAAVVAFDRKPEDLLSGFAPAREAAALLEHVTLEGRNGSHVDDALGHADRLLARSAPGRARRIVLVTDQRTRSALTQARIEALARRSGALVHVVEVVEGGNTLARRDGEPWSEVARQTGGVLWSASVDATEHAERNVVFEELARPVRIDALAIHAPGVASDDLGIPETLDEGMGVAATLLAEHAVKHVVLTGELWSSPVRKVLLPDADKARLWSALAFGTDLTDALTEPEMMMLAQRGRAVSPVTSYLAIEPGVRPSTEGLESFEGSGIGFGGRGSVGGASGSMGKARAAPDLNQLMRGHVKAALEACSVPVGSAKVVLETTVAEIVDVVSVHVGGDVVATDCVTEQLWRVELLTDFRDEFRRWDVQG